MGKIKLVVFDVAGTTATDDGLVVRAFNEAMIQRGAEPGSLELESHIAYVEETMGQRKMDVFLHITEGNSEEAEALHEEFVKEYESLVKNGELTEFEGVSDLFEKLRDRDIGVAITTGFPRELLNEILENLDWRYRIDLSVASDEVRQGRPAPDMIFRSLELYSNLSNQDVSPEEVAVVGDTDSDMRSGVTAGAAFVVGVTSGAHTAEQLKSAGATHVLESATQLLTLINL
jgi:phosphonatase-like hydrolase